MKDSGQKRNASSFTGGSSRGTSALLTSTGKLLFYSADAPLAIGEFDPPPPAITIVACWGASFFFYWKKTTGSKKLFS